MSQHSGDTDQSVLGPCQPSMNSLNFSPFDRNSIDIDSIFAESEQNPSYNASSTDCADVINESELAFSLNDLSDGGTSDPSTPDFASYSLNQLENSPPLPYYPSTPAPRSPNPYPIQQQHLHNYRRPGYSDPNPEVDQSFPFHYSTNTDYVQPPVHYPAHGFITPLFHRRSLSQGDAERIAAYATSHLDRLPNQRKKTSRSRSATPERCGNRSRQHRKEPNYVRLSRKTNNSTPTSIPIHMHTPMIPTQYPARFSRHGMPIGTPLNNVGNTVMNEPDQFTALPPIIFPPIAIGGNNVCAQLTGPRFRHMSHEEQLNKSLSIIEIGAMAVINKSKHKTPRPLKEKDELLKMVAKIERYLKVQGLEVTAKGLVACKIIRESLIQVSDAAEAIEVVLTTEFQGKSRLTVEAKNNDVDCIVSESET